MGPCSVKMLGGRPPMRFLNSATTRAYSVQFMPVLSAPKLKSPKAVFKPTVMRGLRPLFYRYVKVKRRLHLGNSSPLACPGHAALRPGLCKKFQSSFSMLPQLLLAPERSSSEPTRAGALAIQVPPVLPDATCGDVYDWLMATPDAPGVVVVSESTAPLGLVSRHSAVTRYAERYGPELYGRRPIAALMDDRPLTVDESTLINELGRQVAVDHPAALVHGFVVTANGLYRGIGTGQALIRAKVERDARQALELQAAVAESARARQAMSDFLAMMSHALRTPLNAIIGFSDDIHREQFGPLGGARYVEYARDING